MAQPIFTGGDWPVVPSTPSFGGIAAPGGAGSSSSPHSRSRGALVRSSPRPPGHRALPDGPLRALGEVSGPLLAAHAPLMLGDSPVAEAQCLPVAQMPRPCNPAWHSMSSPNAGGHAACRNHGLDKSPAFKKCRSAENGTNKRRGARCYCRGKG